MLCQLLIMIAVHQLKVGDIVIVAALGDSLSVANGAYANHAPGIPYEWRGKAWGENLHVLCLLLQNWKFSSNMYAMGYFKFQDSIFQI